MNCVFVKQVDGTWVCCICGWCYNRALDKPPRRNCPKSSVRPPTLTELIEAVCRIERPKYKTGDILHNLLQDKLGTGFKTGCACKAWITKMNEWGPKGCRENLVKIVNALLAEAKRREWQLDGRPILSKVARIGACVPGSMCFARAWARRLVREAIRRSEQNEKS